MAALAGGHIGVAVIARAAVNAVAVLLDFGGVAGGAELRASDSPGDIVGAVADDAGLWIIGIAQSRVSACGHGFGSVGVAGNAGGGGGLCAVGLRGGSGVAVDAP